MIKIPRLNVRTIIYLCHRNYVKINVLLMMKQSNTVAISSLKLLRWLMELFHSQTKNSGSSTKGKKTNLLFKGYSSLRQQVIWACFSPETLKCMCCIIPWMLVYFSFKPVCDCDSDWCYSVAQYVCLQRKPLCVSFLLFSVWIPVSPSQCSSSSNLNLVFPNHPTKHWLILYLASFYMPRGWFRAVHTSGKQTWAEWSSGRLWRAHDFVPPT